MDIQKIKKIEKKIVAIATVDKKNKPHNIAIQINKIQGDKIIFTDNYMKLTVENIKNNPNVSLVFWHGKEGAEKGYRIDGKAEYFDSGEWVDFVKGLKENEGYPAKGAIIIKINEIK